jgi:hypothetical protein
MVAVLRIKIVVAEMFAGLDFFSRLFFGFFNGLLGNLFQRRGFSAGFRDHAPGKDGDQGHAPDHDPTYSGFLRSHKENKAYARRANPGGLDRHLSVFFRLGRIGMTGDGLFRKTVGVNDRAAGRIPVFRFFRLDMQQGDVGIL